MKKKEQKTHQINKQDRKQIRDENADKAYQQAEKDIAIDPEQLHSSNEDLDEGELARLGENKNNLI